MQSTLGSSFGLWPYAFGLPCAARGKLSKKDEAQPMDEKRQKKSSTVKPAKPRKPLYCIDWTSENFFFNYTRENVKGIFLAVFVIWIQALFVAWAASTSYPAAVYVMWVLVAFGLCLGVAYATWIYGLYRIEKTKQEMLTDAAAEIYEEGEREPTFGERYLGDKFLEAPTPELVEERKRFAQFIYRSTNAFLFVSALLMFSFVSIPRGSIWEVAHFRAACLGLGVMILSLGWFGWRYRLLLINEQRVKDKLAGEGSGDIVEDASD